jgi:hypothetical protein
VAFDPISTDEKIVNPVREADPDMSLFRGFMFFSVASIVLFFVQLWPFFVVYDLHIQANLMKATMISLIPTAVVGVILARFGGIPGATAFVTGAMIGAVFLLLRLGQVVGMAGQGTNAQLEYSPAMGWAIPLGWVIVAWTLTALLVPRKHYKV